MAPKLKFKRPDADTYRSWTFAVVLGLVVAAVALVDRGGIGAPGASGGSTGCQFEVTAPDLRVRAGPNVDAAPVTTLHRGDAVSGTRVVTNGFRELDGGRWAANEFLTLWSGTTCP